MVSLAESFVASTTRPLALRRRPDVQATPQLFQGQRHWVLKDPVALKYFRFQEEEYALWEMLDGQTSLDQIKERFESRFAPQRITFEDVQQFVGTLHKSGLVLSDLPGQGPVLFLEARNRRWKKFLGMLPNLMSLRFRGIDPERLLNWMYPGIRWFFSPVCVTLCLLLGLAALLLVGVQFNTFQARLPSFQNFFTAENLLWISVVVGLTKVLHEFGHGLSCKHFGGECHEMGVMLLVFTPCLYCDVTDSWTLPSKWKRAAIGAAGMYVELVLASIATFVWWFSEPGLLHHLSLNVMMVCSVSTLVFNGNPLLRYDGYYILSDLLEIPNLRQKATQVFTRLASSVCLGIKQPRDRFLPQRGQVLFAIYAAASAIYKWVVLFSILWFLNKFFEPYRLDVIGETLALMSVASMVLMPAWQVGKYFWVPGRIQQVKPRRLLVTLAVAAAMVSAVIWVPFPQYIHTTLVIEPRDAEQVFVQVPGKLVASLAKPGERVEAGQELARLEDPTVELTIAELDAQCREQRDLINTLWNQRFSDPKVAAQIPQATESLRSLEERLAQRHHDAEHLLLIAPRAGVVLPPPEIKSQPSADGTLVSWSGNPFLSRNQGCFLQTGTLLCQIGEPHQLEAQLVIDQADVEFVRPGQAVEILLEQLPGRRFAGEIEEIARQELKIAPRQLSGKAGGRLATESDSSGRERPLSASYQARVPLDDADGLIRAGLRGRARIRVGSQTWGQWLWRYATQTFHFEL